MLGFRRKTKTQLDRIEEKLDYIIAIINHGDKIMAKLDDIIGALNDESTVIAGVGTLIDTLVSELKDALAANDPAKVNAILAQIQQNKDAISQAMARGTIANDELHAMGM